MIDSSKKLNIPPSERKFIKPDVRQKVFKEIYTTYKTKYNIQLMFAYLNTDPSRVVDYIVMYKAKDDSGTTDIVLYDIVPAFSDRCTPGYLYCRRNKKTDDFFENGIDAMTILSLDKFNEFIDMGLGLSRDKESELYWKNPNNIDDLLRGLLDMSLQYKRKR